MSPTEAEVPAALHAPALPEPVVNDEDGFKFGKPAVNHDEEGFKEENDGHHHDHHAVAAAVAEGYEDDIDAVAVATAAMEQGGMMAIPGLEGGTPKKRCKKLPLTKHEALTFANRGVYVDIETGQLRCSCNHKPCDKWDAYGYTRHFQFKCHKKYEDERLDDVEITRLRECKETFLRMNPDVQEQSIRKKRKMKDAAGEKVLNAEELRVQER